MILSLDNLAHRYHMLPSEALERATSFDLYVLDVSSKWVQYQHEHAEGNVPKAKQPSQVEMIEMLKRARGE